MADSELMLSRTHIMVHHSLTRDSQTVSWGAIRRYHIEHNGWDAIGYHYGVELVGDHYEALLGRSELQPAAACPQGQMNQRALHVCCVGNFDEAPPPEAMLEVLVQLVIVPAMVEYGIPPARIIGHRDVSHSKSCPGTQFDLDVVRRMSLRAMRTLAVPGYAEALGVSEDEVQEAFAVIALDYHRRKLAEASAKAEVLQAQRPKRRRKAA